MTCVNNLRENLTGITSMSKKIYCDIDTCSEYGSLKNAYITLCYMCKNYNIYYDYSGFTLDPLKKKRVLMIV